MKEVFYSIERLSNGARVVAVPLAGRRSVSIGVWVSVGGRDEALPLNGVSHFLEHVVFKGTRRRSARQIKEAVEGVGGSLNAFTGEEVTCFLARTPSRHFEGVCDVLCDMVLNASIKKSDVEKERSVILEEIKMTDDQPSQLVEEQLCQLVWPDHALGRPLAGTVESVKALSLKNIREYRDTHYEPGLITVVAGGDVTRSQLLKLSEKLLGKVRGKEGKAIEPFTEPSRRSAAKIFAKKTEQTHLALGLRSFPKNHPDVHALEVLQVVLGGNMSSRLFEEVREKRGLAYEISSSVRKYHETGAFVVSAGVDHRKIHPAVEVILAELRKVCARPVPQAELKRAKDFYTGQLELGLESSMSAMLWAGENTVSLGRVISPAEVCEKVRRITSADVRRVAKRLFDDNAFHLAVVGPHSSDLETKLERLLP